MNIIKLTNLSKSYFLDKIKVNALSKIEIEIRKGEFTAIVGPSGSGKTSLLNIIGLIDKPDAGSFFLNGKDTTHIPLNHLSDLRRKTIGFVFQTFNLIPVFNAFENVEYPLIFAGISKKEKKDRVDHLLQLVGISELARHRPFEMSGGQRQRIAIARALVNNPEVVLADEPTANLDSKTASEILEQMRILNGELNVTFIFASHDPLVANAVDRIIYLRDGMIHRGTA